MLGISSGLKHDSFIEVLLRFFQLLIDVLMYFFPVHSILSVSPSYFSFSEAASINPPLLLILCFYDNTMEKNASKY